jgi:hypothetical protein
MAGQIIFDDTSSQGRNLWPGVYDQVSIPNINGTFTFNQHDGGEPPASPGDATGGEFIQTGSTQTQSYQLDLDLGSRSPYSRVNVSGGMQASTSILGWDTSVPSDGVADYIGLSWNGLGGFRPCEKAAGQTRTDIDDDVMLWVPVNPHPTIAGAVIIETDFDCDGVNDGVFPPGPPIVPDSMVPVELSSFTVASARPVSTKGVSLVALAVVILLPGVRLMRRWLPGLDI